MTLKINKPEINIREEISKISNKVTFDEVVRGLGEYTGNVGIGTTTPGAKLTVAQGSGTIGGNDLTQACFLAGTSSTGIGIDDNEIIKKQGTNGSSLNLGSLGINADIRFKTGADTDPASATYELPYERMRITSDGNVGIGTGSPADIVSASTATNAFAYIKTNGYGVFTSDSTGPAVYINKTNGTTSQAVDYINFRNQGLITGSIEYDGIDVDFVQASDARLKENIQDSESGLILVNNLKVRSFDWVGEKRKSKRFGFVAQEMHEVFEEAVKIGGEDENESPWGISDSKLIPVLTKAIQEQQQIIEDLKSRIETLESK